MYFICSFRLQTHTFSISIRLWAERFFVVVVIVINNNIVTRQTRKMFVVIFSFHFYATASALNGPRIKDESKSYV